MLNFLIIILNFTTKIYNNSYQSKTYLTKDRL
ncbi:Uncharacterised protein [Alistipes finegoldii]|nr:Uncharacterised protein [Alistipes finegoldii]CUQ91441.1 Uncharacterised protein [Alistipes finegoldii]